MSGITYPLKTTGPLDPGPRPSDGIGNFNDVSGAVKQHATRRATYSQDSASFKRFEDCRKAVVAAHEEKGLEAPTENSLGDTAQFHSRVVEIREAAAMGVAEIRAIHEEALARITNIGKPKGAGTSLGSREIYRRPVWGVYPR